MPLPEPTRWMLWSLAALALARSTPEATGAQQSTTFRAAVDLVNIGVTVTDRGGHLVVGLTPDDFEITEDGKRQTVIFLAAGGQLEGPTPELHIGLLLDVSESMEADIGFAKTAAIRFLSALSEAADMTVVDFDSEVRVGRYAPREFARLVERIRGRQPKGSTALYDAIGMYLDGAADQRGRKVMLLYTDGGDTRSAIRFGELLDVLKASDVTVYSIGLLEHQPQTRRLAQRSILQQIAESTGGQAFFPQSARNLEAVYERVLAEIRGQYTLGYLSTNDEADGTWRDVRVTLTIKSRDYRLRSRKGYYAPSR